MGIHSFYRYTNDPSLGEEMASFTYTGEDERVFPTLGITVNQGDKFDAPEGFSAENVSATKTTKATPAPTVGE
jgi:hypothetical protein